MTERTRPCQECGCPQFRGGSTAEYCTACGHPSDAHRVSTACSQCTCREYLGPNDGAFCARCGHKRDAHHGHPVETPISAVPPEPASGANALYGKEEPEPWAWEAVPPPPTVLISSEERRNDHGHESSDGAGSGFTLRDRWRDLSRPAKAITMTIAALGIFLLL